MRTHPLDLLSLTFGLILAAITVLLALSLWTEAAFDLGLVIPVALICCGVVVLVVALVPRKPREDRPSAP